MSINSASAGLFTSAQDQETELCKVLIKLVGRCERWIVNVNSIVLSPIPDILSAFIKNEIKSGKFYITSPLSGNRIVDWDAFDLALYNTLSLGDPNYLFPSTVVDELGAERHFQNMEEQKNGAKFAIKNLQSRNGLPQLPGKWHKEPYPRRAYECLTDYAFTESVTAAEQDNLKAQLNTPLNGFLGQAYNYDDHGLTEEWMVTYTDGKGGAAPSDDDVIRVQCKSLIDILCVQVQDKVLNEEQVLQRAPCDLSSGKLKEAPVWGIDSYTRRMVEIAIEDRVNKEEHAYNKKDIQTFLERILLPAINAQPVAKAHDMAAVVKSLLPETVHRHTSNYSAVGHNPSAKATAAATATTATTESQSVQSDYTNNESHLHLVKARLLPLDIVFLTALSQAVFQYGLDMFKIHPKGTGIIVTAPEGIKPHQFISEYLGDIYPPYRWCERLDVVEQAQRKHSMKPTLPDFYNILLERPRQDPAGYGLLFVDASQKSNMGSSCSHSCESNLTASVVARNQALTIALTTNRWILPGEELTMDYSAMTTSDVEWRAAICLCGFPGCRGSFLHYATQDDLQQVMNSNCGPLWRYASLLKACSPRPLTGSDEEALERHGMGKIALGEGVYPTPVWYKKYVADNLRFLEFERKALPCALLRNETDDYGFRYTFSQADMDARSVMEQRLQALVCCSSMISTVLDKQKNESIRTAPPVTMITSDVALSRIWSELMQIVSLLEEYVGKKLRSNNGQSKKRANKNDGKKENKISKFMEEKPLVANNGHDGHVSNGHGISTTSTVPAPIQPAGVISTVPHSSSHASTLTAETASVAVKQEYSLGIPEISSDDGQTSNEHSTSGSPNEDSSSNSEHRTSTSNGNVNSINGVMATPQPVQALATIPGAIPILSVARAPPIANLHVVASMDMDINSGTVLPEAPLEVQTGPVELSEAAQQRLLYDSEMTQIRRLLHPNNKPANLLALRSLCKQLRVHMLALEGLSNATARLGLLADVLILWAHTASFSQANNYEAVHSDPIPVVARDLGMCVPKTKIYKDSSKRLADRNNSKENAVSNGGSHRVGNGTNEGTAALANDDVQLLSTSTQPVSNVSVREFTNDSLCDPNEVVHIGSKKYDRNYIFDQLMSWFVAGGDEPLTAPDILGCVQLPYPRMCFGTADAVYGKKQRDILMDHLMDDRKQMMPWPIALKKCFNFEMSKKGGKKDSNAFEHNVASSDKIKDKDKKTYQMSFSQALYGSPMLDVALGQIDAVSRVVLDLVGQTGMDAYLANKARRATIARNKAKRNDNSGDNSPSDKQKRAKRTKSDDNEPQFDTFLPPEVPTQWVQCCKEDCLKWRRVPFHVDVDALPDEWNCSLNTWDPPAATCQAPQDLWDPEKESTIDTHNEYDEKSDDFGLGQWRDVWDVQNAVYYEGQIIKMGYDDGTIVVKEKEDKKYSNHMNCNTSTTEAMDVNNSSVIEDGNVNLDSNTNQEKKVTKIFVHFKGWSKQYDEWITLGEGRIQPLNLYTNPMANNPREQEKWQGRRLAGFSDADYGIISTKKSKKSGSTNGAKRQKVSASALPQPVKLSPLCVGDRVQAKFARFDGYYDGVITAVYKATSCYDIAFDDGDVGRKTKREKIKGPEELAAEQEDEEEEECVLAKKDASRIASKNTKGKGKSKKEDPKSPKKKGGRMKAKASKPDWNSVAY